MKRRIRETFPIVLTKKLGIDQFDMIDLVARRLAVQLLPLFRASVTLASFKSQVVIMIQNELEIEEKMNLPREVCNKRVTNEDKPGHKQLLASKAYLNSSSHTTFSKIEQSAFLNSNRNVKKKL